MPCKKIQCHHCSQVMRSDNLKRHVRIKHGPSFIGNSRTDDIPTFSGFGTGKPISKETLNRVMETLKIPEHRREKIGSGILQEDRERDESEDEDGPLTESELKEMIEQFLALHHDLVHKGRRENVPELLNMLGVLLEASEITRKEYMKMTKKIKSYL